MAGHSLPLQAKLIQEDLKNKVLWTMEEPRFEGKRLLPSIRTAGALLQVSPANLQLCCAEIEPLHKDYSNTLRCDAHD